MPAKREPKDKCRGDQAGERKPSPADHTQDSRYTGKRGQSPLRYPLRQADRDNPTPIKIARRAALCYISSIIFGTPPRLWGKHPWQSLAFVRPRYTPTPVGKTSSMTLTPISSTVHPHACGENARSTPKARLNCGTPHACGENRRKS